APLLGGQDKDGCAVRAILPRPERRGLSRTGSSSFLLMDSYMEREAPFSSLTGVSPRLAESAAPAAFGCALDLAGMFCSLKTVKGQPQRLRSDHRSIRDACPPCRIFPLHPRANSCHTVASMLFHEDRQEHRLP